MYLGLNPMASGSALYSASKVMTMPVAGEERAKRPVRAFDPRKRAIAPRMARTALSRTAK